MYDLQIKIKQIATLIVNLYQKLQTTKIICTDKL